jgi:two-component system LytT family response regulator
MKIRTLIADDEPLARERLRTLLSRHAEIGFVADASNGREAVERIRRDSPELVFLDVQMPDLDGFGVIEEIGARRMPATIFVTAYDQYALRAFDVHALDYLLKPFDRERFELALGRAKAHIEAADNTVVNRRLLELLEDLRAPRKHVERLVVKAAGRVSFVRVDEIDWIEAAGNYVRLHASKEEHLLRETMNAMEGRLDPRQFVRVHRSAIVNIDRVKSMQPWFRGDHILTLRDGSRVTLSRMFREKFDAVAGRFRP